MRSKRIILFFLLLSSILVIPRVEADPGWLAGWKYRKSHTITGSADGAQTDYQVGIFVYKGDGVDGSTTIGHTTFGKVYTNNSCQDNFGDIRFTKADEITELDYWAEYNSSGDYAIFWVEVDAIPESPDTIDIYIYYGTNGATATTSNMANTWVDSLDWTVDLTGQFTKYEPNPLQPDHEDTWLTPTDAEYPCRLIVKRAITDVWDSDKYGFQTVIILNEDADDRRDSTEDLCSDITDDTDQGASGANAAYRVYVAGSADTDISTVTVDQWLINDLVTVAETSASNDWHLEGRPALKVTNSIEDSATSMNYWGYSYGAGSGITTETFSYDAVNDVIEWGGQNGATGGEHFEKSPWMVIGKYTANEPEHTSWGSEEEPAPLEAPDKLFGAGFNGSTPVVHLYWKTNLTGINLFEVQNSTDKVSWDYLGQNTTAEYHDFEVVNGTERYYRVRACNFTGGVWDNSTWTDINFEKVYFILGANGACDPLCYSHAVNASSITVVAGTLNDGNLASTFSVDGDWFNVSEVNDTPGLEILVNFTGVCDNLICGGLDVYHTFTGHSHHEVCIWFYNFTSTTWAKRGAFLFNETAGSVCVGLGDNANHLVNDGTLIARFCNPNQGHVAHELHIDEITLHFTCGEEGITIIRNSLFPGLAIGIGLFIIAAAYYYYQRR